MKETEKYVNNKLILGTMHLPELKQEDANKLFEKAIDLGISFFDFADIYGNGKSETIFGNFLKENAYLRDMIIIQTKCGICRGYFDLSKEHIIDSVKASLERLSTNYLDILMLHRFDVLVDLNELKETFEYLYINGKVRCFGVSNMNPNQIELLKKHINVPIIANQMQFSIVHSLLIDENIYVNMKENEGIVRENGTLEYCFNENIMLQAWSPLMASWDDGCFIDNSKYEKLNKCLEKYANKYNVTKNAIALAWIMRLNFNIVPVIGTTSIKHLEEMYKAIDIKLDRKEWYEIYLSGGDNRFLP